MIDWKTYEGEDRIIHAEDKKALLEAEMSLVPSYTLKSSLRGLYEVTEGFRSGQLVVISGPTKNGKTQFCQTLTKHFVEEGRRCLWFSYELTWPELFKKFPMDKLDFYVPNQMKTGRLDWVEQRIIEAKEKHGELHAVFIDHLDFLKDDTALMKHVEINISTYVGAIVQRVKRLAVEHNITIFLMCHLRKNKWSSNELPTSEEIRDSGQIPQLADFVLMMIRKRNADKLYEGTAATLGVMENRYNGRTKKIHLNLKNLEYVEDLSIPDVDKEWEEKW